jgi:hypothetical protein
VVQRHLGRTEPGLAVAIPGRPYRHRRAPVPPLPTRRSFRNCQYRPP